jgi:ABC-2 type transport system permease protein
MLAATLDEKENRVTEMILTTIEARSLIIGKIISLFVVGLAQMLVFALPLAIGYVFFRDQLDFPDVDLSQLDFDPGAMTVGAVLLIGGFALLTGMSVAIGAVMPTAKEAGPFYAVIIFSIIIPVYVLSQIISNPSAAIVRLFTFFPTTAPMTALLRNAFGNLGTGQAIVVIAETYLAAAIAIWLAIQLFRSGSIEYSRRVDVRAVLLRR